MDFLREVQDAGRRAAVEVFSGGQIQRDSPFSPDVPDHLRHSLPDLFDRFPIVLPWEKPQPVDPALHKVWIMDNTAFRSSSQDEDGHDLRKLKGSSITHPTLTDASGRSTQPATEGSGWEVEIIGCYFIKGSGRDPAVVASEIAKHLNISESDVASHERIKRRITPFTDTVLPNRTLRISLAGKEEQTLAHSNYSGISVGNYPFYSAPSAPGTVQLHVVDEPPPFSSGATTVVAEETGWGIISDIDDTIKVTQTPSPTGILHTTFVVETPQPIAGMPELYAHMVQILQNPIFFYLSASPYNLYPFLRRFRDDHYPHGTIQLRDASWQNLGGLITSLSKDTKEYKASHMRDKIHSWFPRRKFVCLGDSTQSDPEAYGEMARTFPGWIRAVFIRKVTDIAEMDIDTKNKPERFEKAFEGLDRKLWHVFTDPAELAARVEALSRDPEALVGGP